MNDEEFDKIMCEIVLERDFMKTDGKLNFPPTWLLDDFYDVWNKNVDKFKATHSDTRARTWRWIVGRKWEKLMVER